MIRDQSFMILDLNEKIKETGNESHGSKNVTRPFAKPMKAIVNINNNEINASKANKSKRFSNLYLKAADNKDANDDDYESVIDDNEDDTDSFITIDSDAESDVTLGNDQSSDSGYTDRDTETSAASSYGVNPLFARLGGIKGDGTESCEDFVFFNNNKGHFI